MAYAHSDERLPRSGSAAPAACALMQAVLGVEFLLGGINKLVTPDYVSHFKDFVATRVGSQTGILAPLVQGSYCPTSRLRLSWPGSRS
jgi:hypothetical protein